MSVNGRAWHWPSCSRSCFDEDPSVGYCKRVTKRVTSLQLYIPLSRLPFID